MQTHTCYIDCQPSRSATGGTVHEMYPAEPNRSAGRYQAERNVGMTRAQYRASGQDSTRNVRVWEAARIARIDSELGLSR